MQTHQDIWWSVSDQEEHAYFRAFNQPNPILEFTPWPIKVKSIVFPDGSSFVSAGGGGVGAGQTPWQQPINGNGYNLSNVGNLTCSNISANNISVGGLDVSTINGIPANEFGGNPAGSNTQIQFNDSGDFGASAGLTYDGTLVNVTVSSGSGGIQVASTLQAHSATLTADNIGVQLTCLGNTALYLTSPFYMQFRCDNEFRFISSSVGTATAFVIDTAGLLNALVVNGNGQVLVNGAPIGSTLVSPTAPSATLPNGTLWFDQSSLSLNVLYNGSWVQV